MQNNSSYTKMIRDMLKASDKTLLAFTETFGCQQNEADTERLRGMLYEMGFEFTQRPEDAALILINTCAIRENAENRVLGNAGALVHLKKKKAAPLLIICGCLAVQEGFADKINTSYRHIDLMFGPNLIGVFPELLYRLYTNPGRYYYKDQPENVIYENLPVIRESEFKAWLSVMYGCDNYCSYCIVPYLRGRERSREPEAVLKEAKELIGGGFKEITLLGQNVNSYSGGNMDFSSLLESIAKIPGDYLLRFMTSHPKDCSERLFSVMADSEHIARHLHLPFQSGSNNILEKMNRGYTSEKYLKLIESARNKMGDIAVTSDVIVGFPGETAEDFEKTLRLVEQVRFDALFTFIYSPRPGTKAAGMPDPMPQEQKKENFERLLELQNKISAEKHAAFVGKKMRMLVEGHSKMGPYQLTARTEGGRLCHLDADSSLIGSYVTALITESSGWTLRGKII